MFKDLSFSAIAIFISVTSFAQENKSNFLEELYAENDTIKNKKGEIIQEVIIISQQQKTIVRGGKTNIKPLDLPQATFVIGKETIKQHEYSRTYLLIKVVAI